MAQEILDGKKISTKALLLNDLRQFSSLYLDGSIASRHAQ